MEHERVLSEQYEASLRDLAKRVNEKAEKDESINGAFARQYISPFMTVLEQLRSFDLGEWQSDQSHHHTPDELYQSLQRYEGLLKYYLQTGEFPTDF